MQSNVSDLTTKNTSSVITCSEPNINNNILIQNEIRQYFNKIYDSNFLMMINELSSSIQSFRKSFVVQSNIIKSFFKEKENENKEMISKIKGEFDKIDILCSRFYNDAKYLFKKMKFYRSNKIKGISQSELNIKNKKSFTINISYDNNGKMQSSNAENNNKKNSAITKDELITENKVYSEFNIKGEIGQNTQKENINNINLNNSESNKSCNSSIFSQNQNKIIEKESNIFISEDKIKLNNLLKQYFDDLIKEIDILEESNTNHSNNDNSVNMENNKLNLNEFFKEKKIQIMNSIKKIINKNKEKSILKINNNNDVEKTIYDLSNKILLLTDENNKLNNKFEKYKSDEIIKKKILENQIKNLSNKEIENEKKIKIKEKEFNDNKNKYLEEISKLKSDILNYNNQINDNIKANEQLKIKLEKISEEKDNEIKEINEQYEKYLKEKEQNYKNELKVIRENDFSKFKKECDDLISKEKYLKEENTKLSNYLNEKENKIKELSLINDNISKSQKINEKEIEQINNIVNDLKIKNSELNNINDSNNKKILSLENKINDYDNEIKNNEKTINKYILLNKVLNLNHDELNKKYNSIKEELSQIKIINDKYSKTITELENKNKEMNNLLIQNKKEIKDEKNKLEKNIEKLQNEIKELNEELDKNENDMKSLNKKLEDKDDCIQEYKNKYESEIKKTSILEKKIQEFNIKEEEENNTECESKKRKTSNRPSKANNDDIENVQKKFRFLYRTMENFNHNKSRYSNINHNSRLLTETNLNNKNNYETYSTTEINNDYKTKDPSSSNNLDNYNICKTPLIRHLSNNNLCNQKIQKINNDYVDDKEESGTNTNIIDNSIENSNIKITPENYSIIKCFQLNNKLRWCLFKKINNKINKKQSIVSKSKSGFRKFSLGNDSSSISNYELNSFNYKDYIWIPYKTNKDFIEFGEISFNDSSDIKGEKEDEINEYKLTIKQLENKLYEKEKEYNKLDNIFVKLMKENKNYKNINENLKKENLNLNNEIIKYNSEFKNEKNFIGVSFIDDDPESSKFLDDKCCEEILNGLNKEGEKGKIKKKSCYNNNLKNCIDILMTKVVPSENIRSLLASILRQLGCSDEDIFRLIGNYRGVISIPFSYNKFFNK